MNIFVTSADPAACERDLDDKRVVNMVLETAQMLCTAAWFLTGQAQRYLDELWARVDVREPVWTLSAPPEWSNLCQQ